MTDNQKANALFKKFQGKADTSPYLEFYEEPLTSSFIVTPDNFWIDTEYIPDTAPLLLNEEEFSVTFENGFNLPVLRRYKDLQLEMVPGSVASYYHDSLADCLTHDYKDGSYHFILKDSTGQELAYGLNSWVVDNQAGVLTFYEGNPEGAVAPFKLSFYKYIGRKTFEGVVKTDGTVQMVSEYTPDKDQDVTTKSYVDVEIKKVQDIVDKLIPDKPPFLRTLALKMHLYKAYEAESGEEHDCAAKELPDIHVSEGFYNGDEGVLSGYIDNVWQSEKVLTEEDDTGVVGPLHITDDVDPYEGENQRKDFHKMLLAYMEPLEPLTPGLHSVKIVHSITGETPEKLFWVDDPNTATVRNTQVNLPQTSGRYISGVPSISEDDFIQALFIILNAVGTHYGKIGAKITSSHIQNIDCDIVGTQSNEAVLSYVKQLVIRPNTYTEKLQFQIVGMNSQAQPGPADLQTLNTRIDTVSNESLRLSSGAGEFPTEFGNSFNSRQDLNESEELQMVNGLYQWPKGDYSQNVPTPGPNYDLLQPSGIRWATFYVKDLSYADGITLRLNEATDFMASSETSATAGLKIYAKIVNNTDSSQTTGWINCNSPYPGVGQPSRDGDGAMVVTSSNAVTKKITFGPTTRTGKLYLRIGFGSGNKKFSTISVNSN